jgi:hypothetical protein
MLLIGGKAVPPVNPAAMAAYVVKAHLYPIK